MISKCKYDEIMISYCVRLFNTAFLKKGIIKEQKYSDNDLYCAKSVQITNKCFLSAKYTRACVI